MEDAPLSPPESINPQPVLQRQKTPLIIAGLAIVVLLLGVGNYLLRKSHLPIACTADAKICADGSSVGRSGPKCEFTPCPFSHVTTAPTVPEKPVVPDGWLKYTNAKYNFEIMYPPEMTATPLLHMGKFLVNFRDKNDQTPAESGYYILVADDPNGWDLATICRDLTAGEDYNGVLCSSKSQFTNSTFNGRNFERVLDDTVGFIPAGNFRAATLFGTNMFIWVDFNHNQSLINQAISTFKFLPLTLPSVDTYVPDYPANINWKVSPVTTSKTEYPYSGEMAGRLFTYIVPKNDPLETYPQSQFNHYNDLLTSSGWVQYAASGGPGGGQTGYQRINGETTEVIIISNFKDYHDPNSQVNLSFFIGKKVSP